MKILFVIPPYRTTDALTAQLYPMPLGPVLLCTILREAGHDVTLVNYLLPAGKSKCDAPESFKGGHAPPYIHYGMPMGKCFIDLTRRARNADVVCLAMGQCNVWETGALLAGAIKALEKPLVIGGPFVSTATDLALKLTRADVAVTGEAEGVICDAVAHAAKRLSAPRIIVGVPARDLNLLPVPDWSFSPPVSYPKYNGKVRGVLTVSRGCPWKCAFCSVHTIMGRVHRRLTKERIVAELTHLREQGVRYFCFLDDNLFISERATQDILEAIAIMDARFPGFDRCRFYMEEGMEVRMAASPGIVASIAKRFDNVAIGLETMNQLALNGTRKPYDHELFVKAMNEIRTAGVTCKAFYILGFPEDTLATVARDLVRFGKLGLAVRPNNLKVYPGTELARRYEELGIIDQKTYDWRKSSWHTPTHSLEYSDIKKLKTLLGAIGFAAEQFGVAIFNDTVADIQTKLRAKKYVLDVQSDHIILTGNMFRDTPYRKFAELLLLRLGAPGVSSSSVKGSVTAVAQSTPKDRIQAAIIAALRERKTVGKKQGDDDATSQ